MLAIYTVCSMYYFIISFTSYRYWKAYTEGSKPVYV